MNLPASEGELANSIRALAMDAVEAANSGHPGMPMGMAEIAVALWKRRLRHNPANPAWPDRDRFVLSNGHGSMLLYSLLHLTGYALPMDELRRFRQLHSRTPGHPERGLAPGVETTTGPLGQGIANAVGMALAERLLAAEFNRPGHAIVDHHTYVFMGDGCMMEGLSHEACSLAGTLGLGKLIAVYDDNGISIDSDKGRIKQWFTDDVRRRFEAYGWQVIPEVDGHDLEAVDRALRRAKREKSRPTLICARTVIAKGAPTKASTGAAHGAPLGDREVAATRQALGWSYPPFEIPENVYRGWDAREAGKRAERRWNRLFAAYGKQYPAEAAEFARRMAGQLPGDFDEKVSSLLKEAGEKAETTATRKASQQVLEVLVPALPELLGGSADLTGSNLTMVKASRVVGRVGGGPAQEGRADRTFADAPERSIREKEFGERHRARRLRGFGSRAAARGGDRDRIRSPPRGRRAGAARCRRHCAARGVDALDQRVRPAERGVSQVGAAAGPAARRGRGRCHRLLEEVRRPGGRSSRHRPLRRIRAGG